MLIYWQYITSVTFAMNMATFSYLNVLLFLGVLVIHDDLCGLHLGIAIN